jgi:hypothetical protein
MRFQSCQFSKLDYFVTVQHVAINNHEPNDHDTTQIINGQGQTAICHFPKDQLLHHRDKETEENLQI